MRGFQVRSWSSPRLTRWRRLMAATRRLSPTWLKPAPSVTVGDQPGDGSLDDWSPPSVIPGQVAVLPCPTGLHELHISEGDSGDGQGDGGLDNGLGLNISVMAVDGGHRLGHLDRDREVGVSDES